MARTQQEIDALRAEVDQVFAIMPLAKERRDHARKAIAGLYDGLEYFAHRLHHGHLGREPSWDELVATPDVAGIVRIADAIFNDLIGALGVITDETRDQLIERLALEREWNKHDVVRAICGDATLSCDDVKIDQATLHTYAKRAGKRVSADTEQWRAFHEDLRGLPPSRLPESAYAIIQSRRKFAAAGLQDPEILMSDLRRASEGDATGGDPHPILSP